MRIIHSSDWHLGQHFMGKSRAPEHRAFFDWLLQQIKTHHVDALIIAGDIFDTGSPPSYARKLYNRFIVDLQTLPCELIILAGNHDSVATLNESKALLACLKTKVISGINHQHTDRVMPLKNQHGEVGAILCAIPFLRKRDILTSKAGQTGQEKQAAMQHAITDYYETLYQQARALQADYSQVLPIIMTGHLVTVGATSSDSVRDIYIGSLDAFPASGFPAADYIALGHIHQPQRVAKSEHIRYSGSPLPLSFDEAHRQHKKSVLLVDFDQGKLAKVTPLEIPCFQPMQLIKGDFNAIETQLTALAHDNRLNPDQTLWLEVVISSQEYLNDLHHRLQILISDLPLEILRLRRERNQSPAATLQQKETLNELSPSDVFAQRLLADEKIEADNAQQLHTLFKQVLNEYHQNKEDTL
ncbi:MAG: exonuclease subunit SbcD [Cocleimonas sp.]|nr:exonuclease subunit SbcD [Cocleimonas sp.]